MPQLKAIRRFEVWKTEPANIDEFFRLMEGVDGKEPLRFRDACVAARVPYVLMHAHMNATPELRARYDSVLVALADRAVHEAVEISDGVAGSESPSEVSAAKLRAEIRLKVAGKWDSERYGERSGPDSGARNPAVDVALLGTATELLRIARERRGERVVVGEVEKPALPSKAA
jgi:hypothetical protein